MVVTGDASSFLLPFVPSSIFLFFFVRASHRRGIRGRAGGRAEEGGERGGSEGRGEYKP